MSRFRVNFNVPLARRAEEASRVAARVVFTEMNGRFQDAIGTRAWGWPRETVRSNGGTVRSPRTIVDTGVLRQSNVFTLQGYSAAFRWTASYSSFVHEGAMIYPWGNTKAQRVYTPPRPWTSAVLGTEPYAGIKVFDYRRRFKEAWVQAVKL